MIQRIQSVFLLIAVILMVFVATFPIAEFVAQADQSIFELRFNGIIGEEVDAVIDFSVIPMSILIGLCIALPFLTIFLFKKRLLQIRLSIFTIIILVGLEGLMYYYTSSTATALSANVSYKLFFVFPLVSAILVFLAMRAIARDEALVRSMDRLR